MNTYNVNDSKFINSDMYKKFISDNPGRGYLKIRAYSASQAVPVSGLEVVVSKVIDNNKVIFFEGVTNESGVIEQISLPTPKLDGDNLGIPNGISYDITTTYIPDNTTRIYKVNMYENVYVIQTINIVPEMMVGDFNGN